jgi:DNA-binding transcriptional ArsR family regulator
MTASLHVIDDVDGAAAVLDPLRLDMLAKLAEPDSAAGLARRLGLPRQQLNYHLRQLEEQGLVEEVGTQQKRGCTERLMQAVARSYLINPATLGAVSLDPGRVPDRMSSAYLVAVAAQAIREVAALRERADRAEKKLPTLTLQAEVRFATPAAQHDFAEELAQELARLIAKYHDEAAPRGRRFRVIAGAYPAPSTVEPTNSTELP